MGRPSTAKVLFLFAYSGAILLVLLLVGELIVRHRERVRSSTPGTMPLLHYPHQRLRHALVRRNDYFGWVTTNSQGFRGRLDYPPKQPGTFRVMAVGGSTTFDTFVSGDDQTWPARLEVALADLMPGCDVEVINAGVPGYRVLDNLIRLHTELHQYDTDVVIIYHAHNDLFRVLRTLFDNDSTFHPTPDEVVTESALFRWLGRNSLLYGKVRLRLRAISSRHSPRQVTPSDLLSPRIQDRINSGVESFAHDLGGLLALADVLEIPVVVPQIQHVSGAGRVDEPDTKIKQYWHFQFANIPVNLVLSTYARFDSVAAALAGRPGVYYVPTNSFDLRGAQWYADRDPIHFSDSGASAMALNLAHELARLPPFQRAECAQ